MAFLQAGGGDGPFNFGQGRQAVVDIPAVVFWLIGALVAAHLARIAMPHETADMVLSELGFVPQRISALGASWALVPRLASFVTYAFVYSGFQNLALVCLLLVAFGPAVARRFGAVRFLALFALGAAAGAALYLATDPQGGIVLVGGASAAACIVLCAIRMTWMADAVPTTEPPALAPIFSARVLGFSIVWVAVNVWLSGMDGGARPGTWQPILAGVLAGLAFSGIFDAFVPKKPVDPEAGA